MFKTILELLGLWKPLPRIEDVTVFDIEEKAIELPVNGGRSSVQSVTAGYGGFAVESDAGFDLRLLATLKHLSVNDRYVAKAINNIVTLADSKETISFDKRNSQAQIDRMLDHLNLVSRSWYMNNEGDSLNSSLYAQIATFGALSAEMEIREDLKGIKKVHLVSPTEIRFGNYMPDISNWPAYQLPSKSYNAGSLGGVIPLNYSQYSYMALNRADNTPYATPPFIAAIKDIMLHDELVSGFEQIVRMVGMLGFLSVKVQKPTQDRARGETEAQYQERCLKYIRDTIAPQVKNTLKNGFVVGFKDTHEFDLASAPTNANSIEPMINFVKRLVFEGLKQDPNFHGENMTVTETFGRVLLSIMAKDIEVYQQMVRSFKERLYMTELRLAGFKPYSLSVSFEKAIAGDKEKHENTERIKIDNVAKKYQMGIISQEQAAKELGYDSPDSMEPRNQPVTQQSLDKLAGLFFLNGGNDTVYPYGEDSHVCGDSCSHGNSFEMTGKAGQFAGKYNSMIEQLYRQAISKAGERISQRLKAIVNGNDNTIIGVVFTELFLNWQNDFKIPSKTISRENIREAYIHYRRDKKVFNRRAKASSFNAFTVPDAVFEVRDERAQEWLTDTDNFYLGKFVTDPDTMERVRKFVAKNYIGENNPIGKDSPVIDAFIGAFEELLWLERWKIRRIIETSVNNARNFAQTFYVEQAGVEKYERIEVMDRLTCPYCRHVSGKEFDVKKNADRIVGILQTEASQLPQSSPFATTIPISEWESLNPSQIQEKGMGIGSLHPHCRGRWIAVID